MKDEAPIAAATLIVMRDGPTAPELLMVERAAGLRFAGGAVAFPGGRIEPVDYASANHSLAAAKVAAIRETAEETGILIAAEPRPCEQAMFEIGVELRAGRSLSAILAERNVRLAIATLVPFARWCPVGLEKRPFDTHFFLARAPEALPLPIADGSEISRVFWTSAKALLDGADQGTTKLMFPTRRNVERLAHFGNIAEACEDAAQRPIGMVSPWIEDRGGIPHLCIPENLGYPVTAEPLDKAILG